MSARVDQRIARGEETHRRIMTRAVDVASVEGLEGLSIGHLAEDLGMSKAGLFAHFGSKEELQLATLDAARAIFIERVGSKVWVAEPGLPRLLCLCDAWLDYVEGDAFRGGCFFASASTELDGRPGKVRERLVIIMREWLSTLESVIGEAVRMGHLRKNTDGTQLAFELHSLELGANWARQLLADEGALTRARSGIAARIAQAATARGQHHLKR